MALRTANISRDIFTEANEYAKPIFQQGPNRPPVDADFNEAVTALFTQSRRTLGLFKTGAYVDGNLGFQIQESGISNVNNFRIAGGDGTPEGAGRMFHSGFMLMLLANLEWNTVDEASADKIHERSTGLTATVLSFSGANWTVNEYVGRELFPNCTVGTSFTVISNTANTITTAGDMTTVASVGDVFRVDPSTPGAPRNDTVYMDIYLDEIDENEDSNLEHPIIGGSPFVSALRDRVQHKIMIAENPTVAPSGTFLDPDGNLHHYIQLAVLVRDANPSITSGEIVDSINRVMIDLPTLSTEVITARGSHSSIDNRLDVSINEDGTLKPRAITDRLDHMGDSSSIVWYPKDNSWQTQYNLHQFRGAFTGEWPNTNLLGPRRQIDVRHALGYPIPITFGNPAGPGGADNDPLSTTVGLFWYNVYLIGKDTNDVALVYSQSGRQPYTQGVPTTFGPLLDSSIYDFPGNGWKFWKFIGAVRNGQGGFWEIVPHRKLGRHVQYELAQQIVTGSTTQSVTSQSLAARIPETSMRANVMLVAIANNDGSVDLKVLPATGTVMDAQEGIPPVSPLSQDYKLRCRANSNAAGSFDQTDVQGWVATDTFQRIRFDAVITGTGQHDYEILVHGYEEFTKVGSGGYSF
jgi:hypothetical protein